MKRLYTCLLLIGLLAVCFVLTAPTADAATYECFTYYVSGDEVVITGCDPSVSGDIIIPDMIDGYPVTSIGGISSQDEQFAFASAIKHVFYRCDALTSVTIPEGVTSVWGYAFRECKSIKQINISSSVRNLDLYFVKDCPNLEVVNIHPDNPHFTNGYKNAVYSKDKTKLIYVPHALFGDFYVPDGVTEIEFTAFTGCSNLTGIWIPDSVVSNYANSWDFEGCTGLKWGYIGDGVKTAFSQYEYFGLSVFEDAVDIEWVKLGKGTNRIHDDFFGAYMIYGGSVERTSFKAIYLPKTFAYLTTNAFHNCSALEHVFYEGDRITQHAISNILGASNLYNAQWHYEVQETTYNGQFCYLCPECQAYYHPSGEKLGEVPKPTTVPTTVPTTQPTTIPTTQATTVPTTQHTIVLTTVPTTAAPTTATPTTIAPTTAKPTTKVTTKKTQKPTTVPTVAPQVRPDYAAVVLSKQTVTAGETLTFICSGNGSTNTLWIFYPDGSNIKVENITEIHTQSFTEPGAYSAVLYTSNNAGSYSSQTVSFTVVSATELPTTVPTVAPTEAPTTVPTSPTTTAPAVEQPVSTGTMSMGMVILLICVVSLAVSLSAVAVTVAVMKKKS